MSTTYAAPTTPKPEPVSHPRLLDYLLMCAGIGLSAFFADLTGLRPNVAEDAPVSAMTALARALPTILLLPVGVILLWPIFYATQWVCGRRQGLTLGEWLLGLAWLAALAFTAWAVGRGTGQFLTGNDIRKHMVLGYVLFMISMGVLALVIWMVSLVGRRPRPWTHTLSVALMTWPAVPLLVMWAAGIKLIE